MSVVAIPADVGLLPRPADDLVMAAQRGVLEGPGELLVLGRPAVVAAHALGDVLGDRLDGEPARFLSPHAAADTVGNHREERDTLRSPGKLVEPGQTREVDRHFLAQRAEEEVVLISGRTFPGWVSPKTSISSSRGFRVTTGSVLVPSRILMHVRHPDVALPVGQGEITCSRGR